MLREKTIEKKEKILRQSTIAGTIMLVIAITYIGLNICAYLQDNNRANLFDANTLNNVLSCMFHNPLYFLPISGKTYTQNLAYVAVIDVMVILVSFVMYQYEKLRVHNNTNTLKGSTEWADAKELAKKYADYEDDKQKKYLCVHSNAILSQNFQMSINQKRHYHALNTLIVGTTGSGKSRYYLKPNLLQMNTSYIVTDPKGEILQNCGEELRRFGYRVKVFDIADLKNCNHYNPMKYCYRESDIKKLVQTFIANTDLSEGQATNKDPFWDDAMNAFLCSCVALLKTTPKGSDVPYGMIPEIVGDILFPANFASLCELTRMANKPYVPGRSSVKPVEGVQLNKANTATSSELAVIFENLRAWEANRQDTSIEAMQKPYALREWENFRIAPEKTSTTILMTTAVRLDSFNIEEVRQLTSDDDINLDEFGEQMDVLFIIISASDKTYKFLAAFLYTQLFDILYRKGETQIAGSKTLKMPNGDIMKFFRREEVERGIDQEVEKYKNLHIEKSEGETKHGKIKKDIKIGGKSLKLFCKKIQKTVHTSFDDFWYDIKTVDGILVSRRPTKALAEKYVADAKNAKLVSGSGVALPCHVRFLLDEFANIGKIPDFLEKLATMRGYEISCTVIVQTMTQLKGIYEKNYEAIDGNCPQFIFLGGNENSNNEYVSKKLGKQTVRGLNNSVDNKRASSSYNVDSREVLSPDELGRMPFTDQIVFVYGEQPIYDKKFDYTKHKNYKWSNDYAKDIGIETASVFDRTVYNKHILTNAINVERPKAIPDIKELTLDALRGIFRVGTEEELLEKAEASASFKRESLISDSEEAAF